MAEPIRDLEFSDVRARSEGVRTSGERYLRSRRQVRGGGPPAVDRPRPLEFDESGFPIAQRPSSFAERVLRLLTP
jgi:hypothetical protein